LSNGVIWIKYSGNPLNLEVDRAVEPWVICDSGLFKMWYTGITDAHRIYYATSSDGINWAPHGMVLDVGGSGSWEGLAVGRPVVLFDGTIYRMWYMGYSHNPFPAHRIGFANSTDGVVWQKYEQNPILIPGQNNGWDDGGLGEFTVFFNGTTYIMWYNGQAYMHETLKIGVATSNDGISWTKYPGNPVLAPGSGWDSYHIYTGPVVKDEDSYLMWYSGQQFPSTVKIGLATSSDGFSWSKYEGNPVLDIGPSGTWDSAYVFASSIAEKGGQLLMWYWGGSNAGGGTENMGLAISVVPCVSVKVNLHPDTLNLRSNGRWVTAYIELPEGHDAQNIDVSTVLLNGTVPIDPNAPTAVGDYDGEGVPDLMVKFDRAAVSGLILSQGITSGNVVLTITGRLYDGTMFEGSDTIRVMLPMPKSHRSVPI
jgi:predicted GH43/DUF377 family glycosyl hydrolase